MPLLPDSISYDDVGGDKNEYSAVVDSSVDRSATEVNLAFAATAQMTSTAIRAYLVFTTDSDGYSTLEHYDSVWKRATVTLPVITDVADGKYLITFPSSVLDEQGSTHYVNFSSIVGNISKATDAVLGGAYVLESQVLTANTIRVYVTDSTNQKKADNCKITLMII